MATKPEQTTIQHVSTIVLPSTITQIQQTIIPTTLTTTIIPKFSTTNITITQTYPTIRIIEQKKTKTKKKLNEDLRVR